MFMIIENWLINTYRKWQEDNGIEPQIDSRLDSYGTRIYFL